MVKMIVLDIDGTISHKGKISNKVIESVKYAREHNVIVTIASGRNSRGIEKIAKELGIADGKTPIIGLNGAEVFYMNEKGESSHIWEKPFPNSSAIEIFENANKNHISLFAYTTTIEIAYKNKCNLLFYTFMKMRTKDKIIKLKKDLSNLKLDVIKFISYGSKENMDIFTKSLEHLNLSVFSWSYVSNSKANVELNMPGINKAEGIKEAANILKIEQKDIVYFGDGGNDIEALEWAGIGVAMGNASDDIKEIANEMTLSVAEDGVAVWIENNIK